MTSFLKSLSRGLIAFNLVLAILPLSSRVQAGPVGSDAQPGLGAFQQVTPGTGWILFDSKLYWTNKNGASWSDISPSTGIQAVHFLDRSQGWVVSSDSSGYILSSTMDGGTSWQNRTLDLLQLGQLDAPIAKIFMDWRTSSHGWLVFKLATGSNFSRGILFITTDGGQTWMTRQVPLGEPVLFTDERNGGVSGGPAGTQAFTTRDGGLTWVSAPDLVKKNPIQGGILERSMSGPFSGWAKQQSGDCSSGTCIQEVRLLATQDGIKWTPVRLPDGQTSLVTSLADIKKSALADTDTTSYQGQGFDTCQIPTAAQLQTWWNSSPYSAVNLYIGGISRACSNSALSASFVSQLNAQGWRFFPTWVGPQAACAPEFYPHKMSYDTTQAYNEGVNEANAAILVAQTLGLTESDGSGTVIYYDLEAYDTNDEQCRAAVNAFIDGWTDGLRVPPGNLAGVYGASVGSAVPDWWTDSNIRPDAVWIAEWYLNPIYRPYATVLVDHVDDTYWSNHQRLRQYAGGHDETWGGLTLNIDSNVLDGPLTVPNGTAGTIAPTTPFNPYPADGGIVGRTSDTWLRWKTTGDTCSIHIWNATYDKTVSTSCSLYHLGVVAPGTYSWQVTATNPAGSTLGPTWTLKVRPAPPTSLAAIPASPTKVDLTWVASIDTVDHYLIFADGIRVATVDGTATSAQVSNLACKTSHEFFIKSNRDGVISYGSQHAITTTPSCAPVLLSPLNAIANSLQPAFIWGTVTDATQYQIQVSAASNFSVLAVNVKLTETSYAHPLPFQANKKYYWRVRALGPFGIGDWGLSSFTTPNPPPAPLLLSPRYNILVTDYTPRFDWRDVTPPSGTRLHHYQVQAAKDSGFANLAFDSNTSISEYTPLAKLAPNRTYYWRVRAVNTLGHSGAWSVIATFRTAIRPPVLLLPVNGSSLVELRPYFDWRDVPGATSYTIHISTSSAFISLLAKSLTLTSNFTPSVDLPTNITLYWRVRANGPNGPSLWSPIWKFKAGVSP